MAEQPYDPVARKERYEREKQLEGRRPAATKPTTTRPKTGVQKVVKQNKKSTQQSARERVVRLQSVVNKLEKALSETRAELSKQRGTQRSTAKKDSDGKTTAKERRDSKEYRDSHEGELKTKREKASSTKKSSSGGGSSKSSSSSAISDMNASLLRARITKITSALRDARRQLAAAKQKAGS